MKKVILGLLLAVLLLVGTSYAAQTKLIVRAIAKDAKFIGTSMGGALVVIRDSESGEILEKGFTRGSTGNTQTIMKDPIIRDTLLSDDSTAKFETTINIPEPMLITIEVHAPRAQKQSMITATTQVWLIPGKDIVRDGITVEIPGFAVDVLAPQAHERIKLDANKAIIPIRVNVVMMWGCSIAPGGLWDANKYEVKAIIKHNETITDTIPLSFANKESTFEGELTVTQGGVYEVIVYAYDPIAGNTGVDKTTVIVAE